MSYNEKLAARVRSAFIKVKKKEEKQMMGGLTFMVNGKMCVGVVKDDLMVRFDPAMNDEILKKKGCRAMDFTGTPMKGYVYVSPEATKTEEDLSYWLDMALIFNKVGKPIKKKKAI